MRGLSIVLVCVLFSSSSSFNPMGPLRNPGSSYTLHPLLCMLVYGHVNWTYYPTESLSLALYTCESSLHSSKGPKKVRMLLLVVKNIAEEYVEEYKETISNSRSEISSSSDGSSPQKHLNLCASRIYILAAAASP